MTDKKEGLVNQKKSTKKGNFRLLGLEKLTKAETEVYHMFVDERLSQANIARLRERSKQSVSKHVKALKDKGAIGSANQPSGLVNPTGQPSQLKGHYIRLHAEHWVIQIISASPKYYKILRKSNNLVRDDNRIILSEKSIQIYSGQSFLGKSTYEAKAVSLAYWYPFFHRLENEFNILLVKDRKQNIRRVNGHCSETNNELSQDYHKHGSKLSVKGSVDGKTWLITDDSFGLNEIEAIHPTRAEEDMNEVSEHFNDIRENHPPKLSEINKALKEIARQNSITAKHNAETAAGLNSVLSLITPQLPKQPRFEDIPKKNEISYVG